MIIKIGIDPDVEKSGVAFKKGDEIKLLNLSFFDLFDYLKEIKKSYSQVIVVIEAGWLNKGNWHKKSEGSAALNSEIGNRTGANHEVGRKIVEMTKYLELPSDLIRPTKMKINSGFFKKITGISRSNQEQRDAYMLIHKYHEKNSKTCNYSTDSPSALLNR